MEKEAYPLTQAKEWDLTFLADYIVNTHQRYVRSNVPLLGEFVAKVVRVPAHADPEVIEIADRFARVAAKMNQHIIKEEQVLFPCIERLEQTWCSGAHTDSPPFGAVQNSVRMMEQEHEQVCTWSAKPET